MALLLLLYTLKEVLWNDIQLRTRFVLTCYSKLHLKLQLIVTLTLLTLGWHLYNLISCEVLPALTIFISSSLVSLGGECRLSSGGREVPGYVCHTKSLLGWKEGSWTVIRHGAWWSHREITQFKQHAGEKPAYYDLMWIILMAVYN